MSWGGAALALNARERVKYSVPGINTVGGVVEAAKPLMVIVPDGSDLVVEARLLNRDAGSVKVGQTVAVKLEAFPFTRHGTVDGRIESIGSDAINDEKLGQVFPVRVILQCGYLNAGTLCKQITPGMTVTADVTTGRRNILSSLISPIDNAWRNAGRER